MQELGLEEPGLNHYDPRAGYKLLNLEAYFHRWGERSACIRTIPVGATTRARAAGKSILILKGLLSVHKTISFEDFITYKGEQGERSRQNACRRQDYIVKDGDVMNLFNV